MNKKTILISIDGMRPDGLKNCSSEAVEFLKSKASYTFNAKTVYPSITLPCHMSLFHSVPPTRHGITTNLYLPMARPINGLFEELKAKYPQIRLTIIGYGKDEETLLNKIKTLSKEAQDDIVLVGKVNPSDLHNYFEKCHCKRKYVCRAEHRRRAL